ncbi:hypothetical protein [Ktedonobacter racemifer]|uniref:hypothetical protein n=1 Tax=Ktedonobacter racemifer TaxID=363277 RepID=UPI0012F86EBF|nr:hypothetical protein [Ktedonobacter racemifer]
MSADHRPSLISTEVARVGSGTLHWRVLAPHASMIEREDQDRNGFGHRGSPVGGYEDRRMGHRRRGRFPS